LTNHEDVTVLTEFLKELKTRTGEIHPEIFMPDDAQQFYNALWWLTIENFVYVAC